jgi:beta-lactamase class A
VSVLARALTALAIVGAFGAGLATGRHFGAGRPSAPPPDYEIHSGQQGYINPLLDCEIANEQLTAPLRPFGQKLREYAASLESSGQASSIAVYYRDLNNGPWFGYRERMRFVPASLAKVPVIIACYRQAETDPSFLSRKIVYAGLEEEAEPGFLSPETRLDRGTSYSVEELVQRTAMYSDNVAARLLARELPAVLLQEVNLDLGVDPQLSADGRLELSPLEYGAFFRVLYNASYLSERFSAQALEAFDRSTFELGLVAGVPEGTAVSHKFGVWERPSQGGGASLQLHDCGIVYHPQRPYLLCVMTSGENYVRLSAAIAAVSRFVYQQIDSVSRGGASGKAF